MPRQVLAAVMLLSLNIKPESAPYPANREKINLYAGAGKDGKAAKASITIIINIKSSGNISAKGFGHISRRS